jgi:superfamily I DNA/RNA helicase/mRNA-degrading endonuclease RelE of RelBE toxin-antitoxin system
LPSSVQQQIDRKSRELQANPHSDGVHKQRVECYADVYRLRVGTYRVFYRIRDCGVDLLAVEHRRSAYQREELPARGAYVLMIEDPEAEALAARLASVNDAAQTSSDAGTGQVDSLPAVDGAGGKEGTNEQASIQARPLPQPLTEALLERLCIERTYWPRLLECTTEDDLLAVLSALPGPQAAHLLDAACGQPLDLIVEDPVFVAGEEATLTALLTGREPRRLDLDPQQRAVLEEVRRRPGPFVITGGPGTGKTMVALYAVAALLERLRADGVRDPRVLYVTFTRTLAGTAERVLHESLDSRDRHAVRRMTLDRVVRQLWDDATEIVADDRTKRDFLKRARQETFSRPLSPTAAEEWRLASSLRGISDRYLVDEIEEVIIGRGLRSVEAYLDADRKGRRVGLSQTQRRAVWRVYEAFSDLLLKEGLSLRGQWRQHALDALLNDPEAERYDAVVADEVQDFDLVGVRLLAALCRDPAYLVLVGDSGQSLYQRSFRWELVQREFPGAVSLRLDIGHRCAPEIIEAARTYLDFLPDGTADGGIVGTHRKRAGRSRPQLVLVVPDTDGTTEETLEEPEPWWGQILADSLRERQESLRVLGCYCAVLVPRNKDASQVSTVLHARGMATELVERGQPVTDRNSVKVLTWHNAKGLEFEVVVVLLPDWQPPPVGWSQVSPDEARESLESWRRAAYVAMTRAMRSLTVIRPATGTSPLLDGFDPELWETRTWSAGAAAPDPADLPF